MLIIWKIQKYSVFCENQPKGGLRSEKSILKARFLSENTTMRRCCPHKATSLFFTSFLLCFFLLYYLFTFLPLSYFLHLHHIVAFDLHDDQVELGAVEHCLQLTVGGVGLDLRDGLGPLLGSLSVGSVGLEILQF